MELINVKDKLPNDTKFRLVLCENGLNICQYVKNDDRWWDITGYSNKVTHWASLPNETDLMIDLMNTKADLKAVTLENRILKNQLNHGHEAKEFEL